MHYTKYENEDGLSLKVPLYDDQIFTNCLECGKEIPVGMDEIKQILNDGGDFASTGTICECCTEKRSEK